MKRISKLPTVKQKQVSMISFLCDKVPTSFHNKIDKGQSKVLEMYWKNVGIPSNSFKQYLNKNKNVHCPSNTQGAGKKLPIVN